MHYSVQKLYVVYGCARQVTISYNTGVYMYSRPITVIRRQSTPSPNAVIIYHHDFSGTGGACSEPGAEALARAAAYGLPAHLKSALRILNDKEKTHGYPTSTERLHGSPLEAAPAGACSYFAPPGAGFEFAAGEAALEAGRSCWPGAGARCCCREALVAAHTHSPPLLGPGAWSPVPL
jgi:hypothetical protein